MAQSLFRVQYTIAGQGGDNMQGLKIPCSTIGSGQRVDKTRATICKLKWKIKTMTIRKSGNTRPQQYAKPKRHRPQ